jgi:hypothetical protein
VKHASFALFALLLSTPAAAQVGYPPEKSPFTDLEFKQEITALSGWFSASRDPAGVAPKGGPLIGARYDIRLGGPAYFTARAAYVNSKRDILDPTKPKATRLLRSQQWPLWLMDVGLTMNLTGQKSYHGLVPLTTFGLGVAADWKRPDKSGYKFGTTFALSFGAGVRWIKGERLQLRADLTDHLYNVGYPGSFFQAASDGSTVLPRGHAESVWKHNAAVTLGASYMFFR